jgi:3-hydroxybutyryl-CoA dehydratase
MLSASLLCGVYGMQLPGPGAVHLEQQIKFLAPVRIGDTVTAHVELIELCGRNRARMRSWCTRQDGVVVLEGEGLLLVPGRPAAESEATSEGRA